MLSVLGHIAHNFQVWTTALANMVNDMDEEYLQRKATNHGIGTISCNSPAGLKSDVAITFIKPVLTAAFSKKLAGQDDSVTRH